MSVQSEDIRRYTARWIIPATAEPIEHGTIEIQHGQISSLSRQCHPNASNLGNIALIPGLINCHTHLEFSDQDVPIGISDDFTQWIRAVIASRSARKLPVETIVLTGLKEACQLGTTTLCEIATYDLQAVKLPNHSADMFVFRELIGLLPNQIDTQSAIAREHLIPNTEGEQSTNIVRGLSPHAPYSVHIELLRRLVKLAADEHAPVAMHLAETKEELELLNRGTGPLARMLMEFDLWQHDLFASVQGPGEYLHELAEAPQALIIHGNYLDSPEWRFIAKHPQMSVVFCPRTHAWFGHDPHPWQQMIASGIRVVLGTDSRASNPDLSLFAELKFLHQHFPYVSPQQLLQLGSTEGARALGRKSLHDIALGSAANLAAVRLPELSGNDPWKLLLHPESQAVGTMKSGSWLHSPDEPLP